MIWESYRTNYANRARMLSGPDDTDPHWVAYKTAWAARDAIAREELRTERMKRRLAENELTRIISPINVDD